MSKPYDATDDELDLAIDATIDAIDHIDLDDLECTGRWSPHLDGGYVTADDDHTSDELDRLASAGFGFNMTEKDWDDHNHWLLAGRPDI